MASKQRTDKMLQGSINLYQLLNPEFKQGVNIDWQLANVKEIKNIRNALEQEIKGLEWEAVEQEIQQQLNKLLDVPLGVVFSKAWLTSKQIDQTIEKQNKEMTGDIAVIPLPEHTIKSLHEPKLKITLNDVQAGTLPLLVKLVFRLNGVLLKIQYGKIQTILSGKCKGIGSLAYPSGEIHEKKIPEFDLAKHFNSTNIDQEKSEKEGLLADDVMTESRNKDAHSVEISSEEELVTYTPIGFGKKVALMAVGVFISLLIIAAIMLLV